MSLLNKIVSVYELPKRVLGPLYSKHFSNLENITEYNFTVHRIARKKGISCMLRVKNEEKKIWSCLNSICSVFDEIIFIDNGSTDNTLNIVKDFILKNKAENITIYHYPYRISRCGEEHHQTPDNSVHSLVYYYNFCLSKCRYSYVCKWDADMILHPDDINRLKSKLAKLNTWWPTFTELDVQTIYLKNHHIYSYKDDINFEIRVFPNRADVIFVKDNEFEILKAKLYKITHVSIQDVRVFEQKDTNVNEFSHWSSYDFVTDRKKREWENFNTILSLTPENDLNNGNVDLISDQNLQCSVFGEKI